MRSKLATLIAHNEGFGVPGAIPTLRNNPGDLRHSPHSTHPTGEPNAIGTIDTVDHGWEDLERQLLIYSQRWVSIDPATKLPVQDHLMTLHDLAYTYAPPGDGNPTAAYLDTLCKGLELSPYVLVSDALKIQA